MKLVTLDEAKEHLVIEHNSDDLRISDAIEDASRRVIDYLNRSPQLVGYTDVDGELLTNSAGEFRKQLTDSAGTPLFDTSGAPEMEPWTTAVLPRRYPSLRRAVLLVLSNFDERSQDDPISDAVKSTLLPLKDPTLA
jgi:hypothetical protein